MQGYCFKCKEKREMGNTQAEWASNGSPGTRGTCLVCSGTIYKVGRTPEHEGLPKPEVTATRSNGKKKAAKKKKKKKRAPQRRGKLVIVESPAKARTIGKYLGRGYTVKSSVGHVRDLLKSRLSVDVDDNFTPEYRVPNEKRPLVKELKAAALKAKEIYLATDPDREGEAIAWHVLESAEMEPERTKRVVFQEITKPAILAAFEEPRELDMDRVNAQQARRILDRLVGYKLSPLLWRKVRGRLSAGRVQSVAVRLVLEREQAIEAFEAREYWTVEAQLGQEKTRDDKSRPGFKAKLHRLDGQELDLGSEADVLPHIDALEQAEFTVHKVRLGQRQRKPNAPFTTSTLQQEASSRINFGTSKTMRIAQQLYEGVDIGQEGTVGLITYMRTDSVTVSKDAQKQAKDYVTAHFGEKYVPAKPPTYKTKAKSAQEAHEAVRPTSVMRTPKELKQYMSRDQQRLYTLIWQRFVSSQMSPAVYDTVSSDIMAGEPGSDVAKRRYLFRAAGSTLRFTGFLAVYKDQDSKKKRNENPVPSDLFKDERLDLLRLLPEQHFTQPPPRFSEATLVRELEENGIGRPSTYAAIISTIQRRGYVEMQDKRLMPTPTGQTVTNLLVEYFPDVLSVDFTARMENALDGIAEGGAWVPVIGAFYGNFSEKLAIADEAIPKMELERAEPEPTGEACPTCSNPLVYREGRFGRFIGCSTFPKCRFTEQILIKMGVTCPKDEGDIVQKSTRKGRVFYGCANYPECDWTSWKLPLKTPCPKCEGLMLQVAKQTAECTKCGERQPIKEESGD